MAELGKQCRHLTAMMRLVIGVVLTGFTFSCDFPTVAPTQSTNASHGSDAS